MTFLIAQVMHPNSKSLIINITIIKKKIATNHAAMHNLNSRLGLIKPISMIVCLQISSVEKQFAIEKRLLNLGKSTITLSFYTYTLSKWFGVVTLCRTNKCITFFLDFYKSYCLY